MKYTLHLWNIFHLIIDFVLHIDVHMAELVSLYGTWIYAILFLIIFCETGLVVTPFLPGDSLLFVAGALAALPGNPMNVHLIVLSLILAAVLGDASNYTIGDYLVNGCSVIQSRKSSNKVIWKRHISSMKSMAVKRLS